LFAGAVNRRALEPIVEAFETREGVKVNTRFDGCGILTSQMRGMKTDQASGFPDTFMACDVYYLEEVRHLFQDAVNVSDADIVIAVQKGNPKNIRGLSDLLRPDVRVVLGQPKQCTIGVLSQRLLEDEGIYGQLMSQKDVPQKSSSAMLVPDVVTGAADAVLAYATDTQAAAGEVDVIRVDSPLAKAIQPFSIARSSKHKYLSRRLFAAISRSRDKFESAGFHWRLDPVGETPDDGRALDKPAGVTDGPARGKPAGGTDGAAQPESP
jgi:ABC-type molybdate transport system substrate-binding protein